MVVDEVERGMAQIVRALKPSKRKDCMRMYISTADIVKEAPVRNTAIEDYMGHDRTIVPRRKR